MDKKRAGSSFSFSAPGAVFNGARVEIVGGDKTGYQQKSSPPKRESAPAGTTSYSYMCRCSKRGGFDVKTFEDEELLPGTGIDRVLNIIGQLRAMADSGVLTGTVTLLHVLDVKEGKYLFEGTLIVNE